MFSLSLRRPPLSKPPKRGDSERTCIATGAASPPEGLLRFALDPAGVVTPDLAARLPGRGAWVTALRSAVVTAAQSKFSRAFRREARLGAGDDAAAFAARVGEQLKSRALASLGLARRAGVAACGFEKVAEALRAGDVGLVVVAADAGDDGRSKIARLRGDVPSVDAFLSAEMSGALGREGLVYVAIGRGREADRAREDAERWVRYAGG